MTRVDDSRAKLIATMAQLLREQGYTGTGLSQVLTESGVSNGSLYHHFPGGMEELAEAALMASGQAVADALSQVLAAAPSTAAGLVAFIDLAAEPNSGGDCAGCPIAPTALESPILSPRLRTAATHCFESWEALIAARLRADQWPEDTIAATASAALALIEGALLLARVSGCPDHLASAKQATRALLRRIGDLNP